MIVGGGEIDLMGSSEMDEAVGFGTDMRDSDHNLQNGIGVLGER